MTVRMLPAPGRHAIRQASWRHRTAHAAGVAVVMLAAALLALGALCGRLAAAAWRRLGPSGRLVAAMVAAWPVTSLIQAAGLLPPGWLVTTAVAGAVIAVCAGWLAALRALGRRRWRKTGGRYRNPPEPALAGHNSERLDAVEERVSEILYMMAEACKAGGIAFASPAASTVPRLTLVPGELHHEEAG